MEVIIEWHREDYICLSLTHLNVRIDKGYIHVNVCRITSRTFPHWWLVARITRRVPLVGQTLLTLPEHLSSPTVFSGVRVTRSLVVCVCFADRCLSFCTFFFWSLCCLFFFDIRILVASLWYLQTLLIEYIKIKLIKLPKFTKRIFCQFSQYYWGTLHYCLFFSKKTDDETTILVVYDIYIINQLLKNDNNKKKHKKKQTN
jgi:hypothetical protein